MNILVFSWRDPKHPLAGGAEQVMHEHMKGWIKSGHKVTLFSSKIGSLNDEEIIDKVKIIRKGYQYLGVQISAFFYYQKNKNKYDFIVDQFHGLPFFTPLYSKKPKIAVIQETAGSVWFYNPFPLPFNLLIGLLGYLSEPLYFLFYKTTNFATGSASAKFDVSKMRINEKNISIWPHGVITYPVKAKKEKQKTITFLGVLSKDKGIFDALEAFKILSQKSPKLKFWVIGKPENSETLKQINEYLLDNNLKNKIKFWGFVSLKKKFELLKRSHVLINPSVREGWGLVNIEANSVGVPVISYKAAGLIDSVKQNFSGIFTIKNSPESIADGVMILLKNSSKYNRLKKTSLIWSKKFNWESSTKISLKTINKIYRKRPIR